MVGVSVVVIVVSPEIPIVVMTVIEVLHQIVVDVRPHVVLVVQSLIVADRCVMRSKNSAPAVMVLPQKRLVVAAIQQPVLMTPGCRRSMVV